MKKLIIGILPIVLSTISMAAAGVIQEKDVQTFSSCNSSESHDVYYYIPSDRDITIYPDDTYWNTNNAFINKSSSSVDIYRHGVISQCINWDRMSNFVRGGAINPAPQYPALIFRNEDGCVFSKPSYQKTSNPTAIDAQIHYTVGFNLFAQSSGNGRKINTGQFYYKNAALEKFICYPNWKEVTSTTSCDTSSAYYWEDVDYHTGECLNYRVFRCGDGLVNGRDKNGTKITGYNNGSYTEECDPNAPGWDSTTCNPVTCKANPVSCGTKNNGTTYFSTKQTTPWLTTTSAGMCAAGLTVGTPTIKGTDSHLEWKCSNANGTQVTCKAYQQYCGDGVKNGNEQCDDGANNGTSTSSCSATCTSVTSVSCGTKNNGTTYFSTKQTTPWLTTTSAGMCAAGLTVGTPTIEGTDSHLEWKCSNANGTQVTCKAYQQYCGDGVKNGNEQCDDGANNGTSASSCSATCTTVGGVSCGTKNNGTTYFSTKQTTPWLTTTSAGMCAAGLTVGTPTIEGTDSHLEWKCSNANGTQVTCKAYQQYCGDGVKNGNEQCDYKDNSHTNWGNDGCSQSCEQKIQANEECNQYNTFYYTLRSGYEYTFYDTFIPSTTSYLYDFSVTFDERGKDYNKGQNPKFYWSGQLTNGVYMEVSTQRSVIESRPKYQILDHPDVRSKNNLYIEYNIKYTDIPYPTKPDDSILKNHKECAYYEISRCGDGIKDTEYGEECDPGSAGTSTLPNGQICNSECKISAGNKGDLDVEKTLISDTNFVTEVGQELVWKVKVTAKGGDVKDVEIKDYLPEILTYKSMNPELPSGITMKSINPTEGADATGNYLLWKTEGTLKKGKSIILTITTTVNKMPKTTDNYQNVACALAEGVDEDCKRVPIETKGGLKVEKKIIEPADGIVTRTGEQVVWKITVKAEGGDVKMEYIKDTLPVELQYEDYTVQHKPEGITIEKPTESSNGREIRWETKGTLKSGDYIELRLLTRVVKMPEPRNAKVINIACAKPNPGEETCATGETTRLWIKKYILKGDKEVKNITLNPGDTIVYKIKFGNDGDLPVYVSVKDFLPKGVTFLSGSLNVTYNSQGQQHGGGEVSYNGKNITIEGIDVALYSGIFLRGGYEGVLIIYAQIPETVADEGLNTTNFACIYNQSGARVDCDNAVYRVEEPKNLCEKVEITKKTFTHDGGSTTVKCTASKKGTILIDCGNEKQFTESNVSSLERTCTYSSNSSSSDNTYSVVCKVNNETSDECKGKVTVKGYNPGGPSCFIAGTKVTMADGSKKNIEDVEIGEKLLGANGNINTVLSFHRPLLGDKELRSINGGRYFVTAEHPFMTTEGWKSLNPELTKIGMKDLPVGLLKVGDILVTENGNIKISSLRSIKGEENIQLYNFMLDGDHTYYADDYLVHNKCVGDCGGGDKTPYCDAHPNNPICELANPRCFNVNEGNFSIESGEYLPFYFNVFKNNTDGYTYKFINNKQEACVLGTVDLGSLKCKYLILSPSNNRIVYSGDDINCLQRGEERETSYPLIKAWKEEQESMYNFDIDDDSGKYRPTIKYTKSNKWDTRGILGEYKFQIIVYKYDQCNDNGEWETHYMDDPICQSNFVLTEPYTVQKTPSGNLTASTKTLEAFKDVEGSTITKFSSYINEITTSDYHANENVEAAMKDFKNKYEKLAVSVKDKNGKELKKVPGKNIYFISGDYTIIGGDFSTPFTFVQTNPNSTITVKGNSNLNMMILSEGFIKFEGDCTTNQKVKGIFYAKRSLIRGGVKKNTYLDNNVWCTNGGLNVKGVLIGDGFDGLMDGSRSHLERWFKAYTENDKKREIMNGASVVIEYSPSIFTKSTMPPGAEDFTTALSIYKQ